MKEEELERRRQPPQYVAPSFLPSCLPPAAQSCLGDGEASRRPVVLQALQYHSFLLAEEEEEEEEAQTALASAATRGVCSLLPSPEGRWFISIAK